jgi:hypothetical protein
MELFDRTKRQFENCPLFFVHALRHIVIPSMAGIQKVDRSKYTYAFYFWKYTQAKTQEKSWRIYQQ